MSSVIGIELDPDTLVLTRRRDFQWTFENLDDSGNPVAYPAGDLYFEIHTGGAENALQEVNVTSASGGTYAFGFKGSNTAPIDYYDATSNPHGIDGDITDALEALPTIGVGNVFVHPAKLVPVWEIKLTLNAGANEVQQVTFTGNPTGGTFKLGYGLTATTPIAFGATAAAVETALEALPGIGAGNVSVSEIAGGGYRVEFTGTLANTNVSQLVGYSGGIDLTLPTWFFGLTGGFFPAVQTSTVVSGSAKLNEQLVNVLNKTINDFFNSFESLLGVDLDFVVTDQLNATLKVTSLKTFVESDLITFAVDVTSTTIEGLLNNVASLLGVFSTINVDFYWNHTYQVEFVNDLGLQQQPALVPDITLLTGLNNEQNVTVDVLQDGKEEFTKWPFTITGSQATIKVESEEADKIQPRQNWQLVFLPQGEPAGGEAVTRGRVAVQE